MIDQPPYADLVVSTPHNMTHQFPTFHRLRRQIQMVRFMTAELEAPSVYAGFRLTHAQASAAATAENLISMAV